MYRIKYLFFIAVFATSLPSQAAVLFSNLTQPGDLYGPDGISFGNNPFLPGSNGGIVATRFFVSTTSALDSIDIPLRVALGPVDLFAYVIADSGGLPGGIIEALHITTLTSGPPVPLSTVLSQLHPMLLQNTPYWIGVSAGPDTFADWIFTEFKGVPLGSSNFAIGRISGTTISDWILGTGGADGREGAFRLNAAEVPEPAAAIPVAAILTIWMIRRIRTASHPRK